MQENRKTIKKYRMERIEDGTEEIITYISDDGTYKSMDKNDVLRYEEKIEFDKIEHMILDSNFIDSSTWYRLKNEKEKEMFMRHYGFTNTNKYMEDLLFNYEYIDCWDLKLPLNEWFSIQYHDGGDSKSSYHIFSLKYTVDDLQDFLSKLGVK